MKTKFYLIISFFFLVPSGFLFSNYTFNEVLNMKFWADVDNTGFNTVEYPPNIGIWNQPTLDTAPTTNKIYSSGDLITLSWIDDIGVYRKGQWSVGTAFEVNTQNDDFVKYQLGEPVSTGGGINYTMMAKRGLTQIDDSSTNSDYAILSGLTLSIYYYREGSPYPLGSAFFVFEYPDSYITIVMGAPIDHIGVVDRPIWRLTNDVNGCQRLWFMYDGVPSNAVNFDQLNQVPFNGFIKQIWIGPGAVGASEKDLDIFGELGFPTSVEDVIEADPSLTVPEKNVFDLNSKFKEENFKNLTNIEKRIFDSNQNEKEMIELLKEIKTNQITNDLLQDIKDNTAGGGSGGTADLTETNNLLTMTNANLDDIKNSLDGSGGSTELVSLPVGTVPTSDGEAEQIDMLNTLQQKFAWNPPDVSAKNGSFAFSHTFNFDGEDIVIEFDLLNNDFVEMGPIVLLVRRLILLGIGFLFFKLTVLTLRQW